MPGADVNADLFLEGGGVKGIAHMGAITTLEARGYAFHRVAGASAGSIAAAFTAACMKSGRKVSDIEPLLWPGRQADSIDYKKVPGGKLGVIGVEQLIPGDPSAEWIVQRRLSEELDPRRTEA